MFVFWFGSRAAWHGPSGDDARDAEPSSSANIGIADHCEDTSVLEESRIVASTTTETHSVIDPRIDEDCMLGSFRNWRPGSSRRPFVLAGSAAHGELMDEAARLIQSHVRHRAALRSSKPLPALDADMLLAPTRAAEEMAWRIVERARADSPELAEKFTRYITTIMKLPVEAFCSEQRPWLAKLFHDHTEYSSLALAIADGYVNSHQELLDWLTREMQMELADETDSLGSPRNSEHTP